MLARVIRFFTHDLWQYLNRELWIDDFHTLTRARRLLLRSLRVGVLLFERIWGGRYSIRASALTYNTLLSLIPLLAFAFSLAKGFGAQQMLEPVLKTYLAAGQEQIAANIIEYVNRTDVKALGTVGLVFMVVTVVLVIGAAENAFNDIWGVARSRPWGRKFADYLSVTVVFPVLVLAASGLSAALSSTAFQTSFISQEHLQGILLTLLRIARYAAVWLAFTFIYMFLPNTKVRLGPAIIGGVIAGSAWLMAQWGYIHFQVGVSRYNAIYGTFAALPIFLVWLYLSWVIILLGAELVHAVHIVHGESRERRAGTLSTQDRRRLALRLGLSEAARLDSGGTPMGETAIIEQFGGLSARQVRSVLDVLDKSQLFQAMELSSGEFTHTLRQSPDRVNVAQFLQAFDREGHTAAPLSESPVDLCLDAFDRQARESPMNLTLRELAAERAPSIVGVDGRPLPLEPPLGMTKLAAAETPEVAVP